jgi:hypothetical protein
MVKENPGVGAGELLVHSQSQMEETDWRIYSFTASFDGRRSTEEEQHGPQSFAAAVARPNQGLFAEGRQVKSVALSANWKNVSRFSRWKEDILDRVDMEKKMLVNCEKSSTLE